ncbi:MAG: UDP-N-acetylmuramoyl-tripeptide--D-alanyl-D-alanine ligase [Firmicutes bacterium]|nr:UDP-N-acetylmuramoyl-tripeptide--D-alanyl-D-alanine ligase [Bacillota bacterium]
MEQITLQNAARAIGAECREETEVLSVCTDTRAITPGCLFVALRGERFDGHDFAAEAAKAGAAGIVCEHEVSGTGRTPVLMVKSTQGALLQLARYYRSLFSIPMVGVTGSVGKTTTKEMIVAAISPKYQTMKTEGNLNNQIGLPKTLFRLNHTIEAAVIEMGMDHFGQIHNLSMTAAPTISVITNIGHSHIMNLGSQEGILKAKLEILDGMDLNAPVVLNGDDPLLAGAAEKIGNPVLLYGIRNPACDVRAENVRETESGLEFDVCVASLDSRTPVHLPAYGIHHVYDALAAFSVGLLLQVEPDRMADGLAGYVPSGMRQHIVRAGGLTVVEDCYNASPDSVKASLAALRAMPCTGRRIAVLGDMLELGDYTERGHRECGRAAAENGTDLLVACGRDARFCAEEAEKAGILTEYFEEKPEAAQFLQNSLRAGDLVLVKASHGSHLEELLDAVYSRFERETET